MAKTNLPLTYPGVPVHGHLYRYKWQPESRCAGSGKVYRYTSMAVPLWRLVDSSVECRDKSESRWRQIDAERTPCDVRAAFSEEICKIAVFLLAVPVQPSRCTSTLQQAARGLLSGWLLYPYAGRVPVHQTRLRWSSGGVRISLTSRRGAVRGYGCRCSIARRPGEGAFSPFLTSHQCLSRCRGG
uniref:Uncharacterized protein n=1 Tax=Ananas comosus var. bracteatus TaxID=296719 RepID=A0A6V7QBN2_ANACO|nr:unnamed protein product [Ananas comosus var. bracteatus]